MTGKPGEDQDDKNGFDMAGALAQISEDLFAGDQDDEGAGDGLDDEGAARGANPDGGDAGVAGDRDDAGAKGGTPEDAAPAGGDQPGADKPASNGKGDGTPGDADAAPSSWTAEAKAHWATIPPLIKQEILRREENFFKGIEQYKGNAAIGEATRNVVAPYLPTLRQYGVDPLAKIQELLQINYDLVTNPAKRVEILGKLMRDFQIDPTTFIGDQQDYTDPAVANLKKELGEVTTRLTSYEQAEQRRAQESNLAEVNAFLADPANTYVQEVVQDMVALLNAKACKTLREAYEKAVWANPVTRTKEQQRLAAETKVAQEKAQTERVAAAKAATAANVRSNGRQGKSPETVGSMDDTISETLRKIKTRS